MACRDGPTKFCGTMDAAPRPRTHLRSAKVRVLDADKSFVASESSSVESRVSRCRTLPMLKAASRNTSRARRRMEQPTPAARLPPIELCECFSSNGPSSSARQRGKVRIRAENSPARQCRSFSTRGYWFIRLLDAGASRSTREPRRRYRGALRLSRSADARDDRTASGPPCR